MDHLETLASDGGAASTSTSNGETENKTTTKESGTIRKDCVDAWFTDLFVRCNNHRAVEMYEKLGYSVFRRVVE
jgi:N-terminal acetyltransferase B complex catalytic subunit